MKVSDAELKTFGVSEGDVFFCRSSLKFEGIAWGCLIKEITEPTVFECHIIRARVNKEIVLPAFVSYFAQINFARKYLLSKTNLTTMATIDQNAIENLPIITPPLPIQEKLVEEMERARESRRRKLAESESIISQANEEFQNQLGISLATNTTKRKTFALKLNQLQGKRLDVNFHNPSNDKVQSSLYENRPLKSLVTLLSGGTPSKSEAEFWNGNIPWVSPKDFKEFYLNDSEDHISEKGVKDAGLKLIPKHSVLMVVRSGVLIHSLPVAFNLEPITINQDLKALITNDDINAEYLAFYLRVLGKRLLPTITKHSTTVQSVNTGEFEALQIPVPPLLIQQKLVDELKDVLETSKRLKSEAESEWQAAKDWFEAQLLGK